MWAAWWAVIGCGVPEQELHLQGPGEVHLDALGPVQEGPVAVLDDGSRPDDVVWTADPEAVAHVREGAVHAVGPGTAVVTASWHGQTASYRLVVEPVEALRFRSPPDAVEVGASVPLAVVAGEEAPAGALHWASSHTEVLTVAPDGTITGRAPGTAWVTVTGASGGTAMVELAVVAPPAPRIPVVEVPKGPDPFPPTGPR
ncbi:MAG: Ig-like domain-containing protein [Alphaproteobacteria bacterium]|nr:Ig-like domain-containing protein [Alphaproteobacteria bacterium]